MFLPGQNGIDIDLIRVLEFAGVNPDEHDMQSMILKWQSDRQNKSLIGVLARLFSTRGVLRRYGIPIRLC